MALEEKYLLEEGRNEKASGEMEKKKYSKLPIPTIQYFERVEAMLDSHEFENEEDKLMFIGNVFMEVEGQELLLAFDQDASRILEKLLRVSSNFHIRVFLDKMTGQYMKLFTNRYGSHVLQTLLTLLPGQFRYEDIHGSDYVGEEKESLGELSDSKTLLMNICDEVEKHISVLLVDKYASHVFRVIIFVLSGTEIPEEVLRSKSSRQFQSSHKVEATVSDSAKERLKVKMENKADAKLQTYFLKFVNHFISTFFESQEKFCQELFLNPIASPVFQ
eukprot:Sdes_comp20005_c0_seq1m12655